MREQKLYEDVLDDIDEIGPEAEEESANEEEWVPEPGWDKSFIWFMWESASERSVEKYAEKLSHYLDIYAERFRMKTFSEEESGRIVDMFKSQRLAPDRSIIIVQFDVRRDIAAKLYIILLACGPSVPYGFFVNRDGFLERDGYNLTTIPSVSRKLFSGNEKLAPHE